MMLEVMLHCYLAMTPAKELFLKLQDTDTQWVRERKRQQHLLKYSIKVYGHIHKQITCHLVQGLA